MSDLKKIGAMWLKTSKSGNKYLSGIVNDQRIVVFKNTKKDKENQPDYQIYEQGENKPKNSPEQEAGINPNF